MSDAMYKLSITGPGVAIERDITDGQLIQIVSIALGSESWPVVPPSGNLPVDLEVSAPDSRSAPPSTQKPKLSIREFISSLKTDSNPARIAAIALYIREHLGEDRLDRGSIANWFTKAGLSVPRNLPRDIQNAVRQGLIAVDPQSSDRFYVTAKGEKELGFD